MRCVTAGLTPACNTSIEKLDQFGEQCQLVTDFPVVVQLFVLDVKSLILICCGEICWSRCLVRFRQNYASLFAFLLASE